MRLKTVLRDAPKAVLESLEKCGIKTTEDFVFSSCDDLFRTLPPDAISFVAFQEMRDRVIERLSAEGSSADSLSDSSESVMVQSSSSTNLTGHCNLDALLAAVTPGLIEVSGGNESHNTLLALNIALSYLESDRVAFVNWIDTSGYFSPEQALSILGKRLHAQVNKHELPPESVLARLRVSLAFDLDSVNNVLEDIKDANSPGLIVIDSITPLLGPSLSSVTAEGHALMTIFMQSLQDLAVNYGLIFLILNRAVTVQPPHSPPSLFTATKLKPALGPTFSFLTDTTLWISRATDVLPNVRFACSNTNARGDGNSIGTSIGVGDDEEECLIVEVVKSRSSASRKWWPVVMKGGILQERPSCTEAPVTNSVSSPDSAAMS